MPQAIEFWPLNLLSEVSGVHRDFISQSGSCLGSVRVHSLTLSYTPGSLWCDSRASSWPAPLQPFALVTSPKLGLRQCTWCLNRSFLFYYKKCIHEMTFFFCMTCRLIKCTTKFHAFKKIIGVKRWTTHNLIIFIVMPKVIEVNFATNPISKFHMGFMHQF